jgi:hypothetical protein
VWLFGHKLTGAGVSRAARFGVAKSNQLRRLNNGHVVFEGTPADLASPNLMRDFLGIAT